MSEISSSQTIGAKVAEKISAATNNGSVLQSVIDRLATLEIERRADALLKAINLAFSIKKDLYKVKPDIVAYTLEGTIASEQWSKAKLEERKKLTEKLEKVERIIAKAVDKGDYSDIFNLE